MRVRSPSRTAAPTSGAVRSPKPRRLEGRTSRALHAAALVALLVGALAANIRRAGTSPIVWLDTFNDDSYVEQCLHDRTCTLTGVATSVPGRVHAVAWLELRTLLAYCGADDDAVHVVMQVLAALAVVLTFELALRLGGPLAGVAAAYALAFTLNGEGVRVTALYNSSVLGFLGAVLLLACTAAVERANGVAITLAALVAAVMANVHIGCLIAGMSVLWVALLAPSRRPQLVALAFGVFLVATFAIAPPSWLQNVASLRDHPHRPRTGAAGLDVGSTVRLTLMGVGAWLVSVRDRSARAVAWRRCMHGALAVAVPVVVASYIWPFFGMEANAKYLAHIAPAAAILAGVPIAIGIGLVVRRLVGETGAASAWRVVDAAAPFALALCLPLAAAPVNDPTPTVRDLTTVTDILRRDYGWDTGGMLERLKSPDGGAILTALGRIAAVPDRSPRAEHDASTAALFMTIADDDVPAALPPDWRIIRRAPPTATVLMVLGSRVDWRSFEVCMQSEDDDGRRCAPSGFVRNDTPVFAVRNMPPPGPHARGTLMLRLTVRPGAANETIFMPRLKQRCGGYVVDEHDPAVRVAADRRQAVVAADEGGRSATVTLAWQLGSPECQGWAYDGLPPFVVAGDSEAVARIEPVLRAQERF